MLNLVFAFVRRARKGAFPVLVLVLLAVTACARRPPLAGDSAGEAGGGSSKRDGLLSTQPTGSCGFGSVVAQVSDGSVRGCTPDPTGAVTCQFAPYLNEYVQLQIFSRDGGPVTVDYGQAFNGTSASLGSGQLLPPLTVSDGSDGRTNCDSAVIYGLDPQDSTRVGCRVTMVRAGNAYGYFGCKFP